MESASWTYLNVVSNTHYTLKTQYRVLICIYMDCTYRATNDTRSPRWCIVGKLKVGCTNIVYIVFDTIPPGGAVIW